MLSSLFFITARAYLNIIYIIKSIGYIHRQESFLLIQLANKFFVGRKQKFFSVLLYRKSTFIVLSSTATISPKSP